ncbi:response regulator transcription factor [Longirhabdus pacifica]|uniref:response regulator transcription factor n=1 Tax=Longirhabdus pacifica TaxID=2305227 RepID=UPI001008A4E4|nr:response regulator transcription factor [Longirhabdus pacifica]
MEKERNQILVIDDDQKITSLLKRSLAFEGFLVETANNGEEGLNKIRFHMPDLIILDVMMPKLDGLEVCRRIRESGSQVPIMMLTAKDEIKDKVTGLDIGADDYIVKPFAYEELLARVRALLRRFSGNEDAPVIYRFEDLELNVDTRECFRDHRKVELTTKEFELLYMFLENVNRVMSRDLIMERIWGFDYSGESNVLEVYINALRQKTEEHGGPRLIKTVRGAGYVMRRE